MRAVLLSLLALSLAAFGPCEASAQSAAGAGSTAQSAPPTSTHTPHKLAAKPAPHTAKQASSKTSGKTPVLSARHGITVKRPVHPLPKPVAAPKIPAAKAAEAAKPAAKPATASHPAAPSRPVIPADEGPVTHLHLPRFASLKTDDVNMRHGPGARYPVMWTYKRRDLPVKIEGEFDVWRLVEDMDGVKGWVHQATLSGRRSFVITGTESRTMRDSADPNAAPVAVLKPGVVGRLHSCDAASAWCQVQVDGYRGWLERDAFWGTDPGEAVQP